MTADPKPSAGNDGTTIIVRLFAFLSFTVYALLAECLFVLGEGYVL